MATTLELQHRARLNRARLSAVMGAIAMWAATAQGEGVVPASLAALPPAAKASGAAAAAPPNMPSAKAATAASPPAMPAPGASSPKPMPTAALAAAAAKPASAPLPAAKLSAAAPAMPSMPASAAMAKAAVPSAPASAPATAAVPKATPSGGASKPAKSAKVPVHEVGLALADDAPKPKARKVKAEANDPSNLPDAEAYVAPDMPTPGRKSKHKHLDEAPVAKVMKVATVGANHHAEATPLPRGLAALPPTSAGSPDAVATRSPSDAAMGKPAAASGANVGTNGGAKGPGASAAPSLPSRNSAKATVGCLIGPERVADLGSPVVGVVSSIAVDTGDEVLAGQALIKLHAEVERAGVEAAEARAGIEADIRASEANLELAKQRLARAQQLQEQGFVSSQATEQAQAETDVAQQKLEQARGQRQVSTRELSVVRAQLGQRIVKSPFDGVVTDRFVNPGERVEDKPLLRVAMLNPLRVELVMPANRYGTVNLNDRLSVLPDLPGAEAVVARVTHVDKVIDAASNTFRVRLNLPNPGHKLPAGARCKLSPAPEMANAPGNTPASVQAPNAPTPAAQAQVAKKAG